MAGFDKADILAWSPDGRSLAVAARDLEIRIGDTVADRVRVFAGLRGNSRLAYSPDGKTIVSGGTDGHVRFWDTATGEERYDIPAHGGAIATADIAPDGGSVLTASFVDQPRMWDLATGKELPFAGSPSLRCSRLSMSPDGGRLASMTWEGAIDIRSSGHRAESRPVVRLGLAVYGLAWSPDGRSWPGRA